MIWYITLWTNNFDKSVEFYDKLLWEIWWKRFMETSRSVVWSFWDWKAGFSVMIPYDKQPASIWNWNMIALKVDTNEEVDKMYKKAIELWATDEWEPWLRWGTFYAWYFRDLDWNKLNFFNM